MSIYITKLLDKIRVADENRQSSVMLSLSEAKGLHQDITKLLLAITSQQDSKSTETLTIEVKGENF